MLLPSQRRLIERVFRAKVYDSYGHMEGTVAASECPHGSLHINPEYGVLELVDKSPSDESPAGKGPAEQSPDFGRCGCSRPSSVRTIRKRFHPAAGFQGGYERTSLHGGDSGPFQWHDAPPDGELAGNGDRRGRHGDHRPAARGGPPGVLRVDGKDLWWPDYPGNKMFSSLGIPQAYQQNIGKAEANRRPFRHRSPTLSSGPTPASRHAAARPFDSRSNPAYVSVPRSSMMAARSPKRAAPRATAVPKDIP